MRRAAVSLLELLVTIAVIAILTGLLLAAVQKVRAAAARIDCANREKQLALAMIAHHDVNAFLPAVNAGLIPRERYPFLGWPAKLLPYLEQDGAAFRTEVDYARNRDPFVKPVPHRNLAHIFVGRRLPG